MSFITNLVAALNKIEKYEGSASEAFLQRLGQLEEDLKNGDTSSIPYSIALLIKTAEQADPSCAYVCTCAARLTVGKTRLDDIDGIDDIDGKTIKNKQSDLAINIQRQDKDEEFERDLRKLPLSGQELVTRWNGILSLPRITTLKGRVTTIKRAFTSSFFNLNWSEGLRLLARSKFLTGGGSRRWRANIDWFLSHQNLEAIINGQYDDHKNTKQQSERKYDKESI